ncbi:hypothetical protein PS393_06125, partial [Limosilactobacillus fermentum]
RPAPHFGSFQFYKRRALLFQLSKPTKPLKWAFINGNRVRICSAASHEKLSTILSPLPIIFVIIIVETRNGLNKKEWSS